MKKLFNNQKIMEILETTTDMIVVADTGLNFQYGNRNYYHFFHIKNKTPDPREIWKKIYENAKWDEIDFSQDELNIVEQQVAIPISTYIHYEITLSVNISKIKDHKTYIIFVMKDISPVESLKLKLQETSLKYKILFEEFPLGICILNKEGKIVEINNKGCEISRTSREKALTAGIDHSHWKVVDKDKKPLSKKQFAVSEAIQKNMTVHHSPEGLLFDNGDIVWLSVTATPFHLNDFSAVVTYRDITKEINIIEEMNMNKTLLQNIIEDQTFMIVRYDLDWNIMYANPAFCKFFNKTSKQVNGNNLFDNIIHENSVEFKNNHNGLSSEKPINIFSMKFIPSNGKIRWISWTICAIFDSDNNHRYFQSVGNDVTYDKLMELKEQKVVKQLKEIYQDLQDFDEFSQENNNSNNDIQLDELGITLMERKVIRLLVDGMTNKKIGNELCIAESTVKKYLSVIYEKMEVRNRIDLINYINNNDVLL